MLNAANEVAVEAFLAGQAEFLDIGALVDHALSSIPVEPAASLEAVEDADRRARELVRAALAGGSTHVASEARA